jgi:hypothetical protein
MKLKHLGTTNFGTYDFGGERREARPGETFECSDRLGNVLLVNHPGRFEVVSDDSGAEEPADVVGSSDTPVEDAPDSTEDEPEPEPEPVAEPKSNKKPPAGTLPKKKAPRRGRPRGR